MAEMSFNSGVARTLETRRMPQESVRRVEQTPTAHTGDTTFPL